MIIDVHKSTLLVINQKNMDQLLPGLILRPLGFSIFEFDSILLAYEQIPKFNTKGVLIEFTTANHSSIDFLKSIKKNKKFYHIPVIAYTTAIDRNEETRLKKIGFDAILQKPITARKSLRIINLFR